MEFLKRSYNKYLGKPGPLNVGILLSTHTANHPVDNGEFKLLLFYCHPLPVVVHRIDDGGVLLGTLEICLQIWIKLSIQTLPLVTALRKKGSSFPANLANSSYFSRPIRALIENYFHGWNLTGGVLDRVRHDLVSSAGCSEGQAPLGHLTHSCILDSTNYQFYTR